MSYQHQSHKLTYGSCALRRWPSPQHGMKGTRAGRNGQPSHRLPVRQQHPLSLGPCLHIWPTRVQTTRGHGGDNGAEKIPGGGVSRGSRGLTFPHQHPTSVHPPPTCTPNPRFTNSQDLKSQILMPPPPPPHLLPISRLLQQSVHELTVRRTSELTVYPTPKSVTAPTDPLGCQILCSAAVCCGWEE